MKNLVRNIYVVSFLQYGHVCLLHILSRGNKYKKKKQNTAYPLQ